MKPKDATHAFIGRFDCGCLSSFMLDLEDEYTMKTVADMVKSGQKVAREPFTGKIMFGDLGCKCRAGAVFNGKEGEHRGTWRKRI